MELLDWLFQETSDPRVKHWSMMSSPAPASLIIATYLLIVKIIVPSFMKNRKAFSLKTIIRYYNTLLIFLYSGLIYLALSAGYLQGKYSLGCQPVDFSNDYYAMKLLNVFYWNFLIKLLELTETVFFALRKKDSQVSGLHLYHHSSTILLSWIACKYCGGGMVTVPIIINSFIHVLMYIYYYLSTFGAEAKKILAPWKSKLTILQMIQFAILLSHAAIALQPNCPIQKIFAVLYVPNIVIIFKMFYDFYQKTYEPKIKSKAK